MSKLSTSPNPCQPDIATLLTGESELCRRDICAVIKAVRKLGSEWRILISYYLLDNSLRFNDLLRKGKPDDLNARTLSRTLKYLQKNGIVERTVVGTEPFSVVYSLTEKGRDLGDVLSAYRRWGEKWTPSIVHPLHYPKTRSGVLGNRAVLTGKNSDHMTGDLTSAQVPGEMGRGSN